jgi:osmoprotectant transport system ATP-binding protein
MIRFDKASVRYGDGTSAVEQLSLTMPGGELTALVGPSGSGKSTSLRMINRMVELTSGRVLIAGTDIAELDQVELRRSIGYVIQDAGLFPHRTVADNIATVPRLLGRTKKAGRARATELMELVGLGGELAKKYPAQLSGGQQQRVGVARALAADPPILLMDEPFSAVDPVVRAQLQAELVRIQREVSKTIVFVTHDIDEAIKLADNVAVLDAGGRLAQMAPPAELLARPGETFVADFVGRDRGYRALGFVPAPPVTLRREDVAIAGQSRHPDVGRDGWILAVDGENKPQGWLFHAPGSRAATHGEATHGPINLGGTLARTDGTLREMLDAALSSPSGRGVITHPDGTLAGTITGPEVLQLIQRDATETAQERQLVGRPAALTTGATER